MTEEILELYHQPLQSWPIHHSLILSHGDLDFLRVKAEKMGTPCSYLVQIAAKRKDVPVLISLMVASVFFILPAYSKKASSPTKQGELMAMGIPVICNDNIGDL